MQDISTIKSELLIKLSYIQVMQVLLTYKDIWDIRTPGQGISGAVLDCINPGISYTPGNGGWFFWAMGIYGGSPVSADFYVLYKIFNPLTALTIRGKVLPVQLYTSPPLANQLGGGMGIETIGWITKGPVIRDGMLLCCRTIFKIQLTLITLQ
ncbi:MAG: hypothetical protein MZV64_32710 [Ignavibacteriales bacterium]|nr:hypothetical protein [Ignavibacteriales bacterium]